MDIHILFIHTSIDGQLGCFHFWDIMNTQDVNYVQVFVWTYFRFS